VGGFLVWGGETRLAQASPVTHQRLVWSQGVSGCRATWEGLLNGCMSSPSVATHRQTCDSLVSPATEPSARVSGVVSQVAVLWAEMAIEQLDRAWEREWASYMTRDHYGNIDRPLGKLGSWALPMVSTMAVAVAVTMSATLPMLLVGFLVMGVSIWQSLTAHHRARALEAAELRYKQEREVLKQQWMTATQAQ
jgi:hypothetical protein